MSPWIIYINLAFKQKALKVSVCIYIYIYTHIYKHIYIVPSQKLQQLLIFQKHLFLFEHALSNNYIYIHINIYIYIGTQAKCT